MKEFYYLRKEVKMEGHQTMNVPYATVAVEINEDKTVNRGVSVCSKKDKFVKSKGRNLALARLEYAKKAKENKYEVKTYTGKPEKSMRPDIPFKHLVCYRDVPNDIEKKMFKRELNI